MKIVLSHPTGNANVRATLKGLNDYNLLNSFHTTIATFPGNIWDKLSRFKRFKDFNRRTYPEDISPITLNYPFKEVGRLLCIKAGIKSLVNKEDAFFSIDSIYRSLDKEVAKYIIAQENINAIYAYEDGALSSFREAKQKGIKCIYDLPIGYWKKAHEILEIEKRNKPEWASTIMGLNDTRIKLERKDQELFLADQILVASSFTELTLKEYQGNLAPITIVPYGFPNTISERHYEDFTKRPLKILFVGGLSQRKGICYIFEAVQRLGNSVTLTIIGKKVTNDCKPLNEALKKHKWIPTLPHDQILNQMRNHDVLVFPSLFEGFGLVITEAMSQGTPVITTERTAGRDLIENNKNGWLIEAGSTNELFNCLKSILDDSKSIEKNGMAALKTAQEHSWDMYSKSLIAAISKLNFQ